MHKVDIAELIQRLIQVVEALGMSCLPLHVRSHSRQTHSQPDWRIAKRIDKALGNHRIVPLNVVPVGLYHQECSIGILKEFVEVSGACIKASKNWLCSHFDQCLENWTAPR